MFMSVLAPPRDSPTQGAILLPIFPKAPFSSVFGQQVPCLSLAIGGGYSCHVVPRLLCFSLSIYSHFIREVSDLSPAFLASPIPC